MASTEDVREQVRERYSAAALTVLQGHEQRCGCGGGDDCCGDGEATCCSAEALDQDSAVFRADLYQASDRFTPARNHVIDPVQPTRSATTVAGMSGVSCNSARTRGSNATKEDSVGVRSYCGGESVRTAFSTVVREIPSLAAIRAFGTPSAANRRINAQSSKVITLQSSSVHFSPPKLTSFRAPPTAGMAESSVARKRVRHRATGLEGTLR